MMGGKVHEQAVFEDRKVVFYASNPPRPVSTCSWLQIEVVRFTRRMPGPRVCGSAGLSACWCGWKLQRAATGPDPRWCRWCRWCIGCVPQEELDGRPGHHVKTGSPPQAMVGRSNIRQSSVAVFAMVPWKMLQDRGSSATSKMEAGCNQPSARKESSKERDVHVEEQEHGNPAKERGCTS